MTVCNKFGKELHLLCPFGLVFDGTIEECKDRKLVAECAKEPQKKKSSSRSLDGLPANLCEGAPDGFHSATECSTSVVQCTGGAPSLLECPKGQAFDNKKFVCASPDDIVACKAAQNSKAKVAETPQVKVVEEQKAKTDECEGLADGLFEKEPCSSFFLTCSGGVSRIMSCPSNLVFDKKFSICEYPGNVEGCSTLPTPKVAEVCAEDGFFSYGNCSDLFYACSSGRQIPMYCPAKLAFDEKRQLCDYPLAVASCVEEASGNDGNSASGSAYPPEVDESWDSSDEEESSGTHPEQPTNFCESKEDGFYASGCSSEMIACVGGQATSMLCPAHLIYDEQKRICEYPLNVPCFAASHDAEESHEKCNTKGPKANGPCSSTFTNCVDGQAFLLACDEGYVFSDEHGSCVESSKVNECSTVTQTKQKW